MEPDRRGLVRLRSSFTRGSAVVFVVVGLGLGFAAWALLGDVAPRTTIAMWALAALALAAAFQGVLRIRRLEGVTLDRDGVRAPDAFEPWATLVVEGDRRAVTFRVGPRRIDVSPELVTNAREVIDALRERVDPRGWRVRERYYPRWSVGRPPPPRPSALPTTATYRDRATPATSALPVWWDFGPRVLRRRAALGLLALFVGLALVVTHPRPRSATRDAARHLVAFEDLAPPDLGALVGWLVGVTASFVGALGVAAAIGGWIGRRDELFARRWLGEDAVGDGHGHAHSADGRRRTRIETADPHSVVPEGAYLDELDAAGRVVRSIHGPAASPYGPIPATHARWVARLPRPMASGRHARVLRRPLGGALVHEELGEAHVLVLDVRDDGVVLVRFSESRHPVGTTWHPTRYDAEAQIADEYGVRDLELREAPLDEGAISFLAYA